MLDSFDLRAFINAFLSVVAIASVFVLPSLTRDHPWSALILRTLLGPILAAVAVIVDAPVVLWVALACSILVAIRIAVDDYKRTANPKPFSGTTYRPPPADHYAHPETELYYTALLVDARWNSEIRAGGPLVTALIPRDVMARGTHVRLCTPTTLTEKFPEVRRGNGYDAIPIYRESWAFVPSNEDHRMELVVNPWVASGPIHDIAGLVITDVRGEPIAWLKWSVAPSCFKLDAGDTLRVQAYLQC